MQQKEHPVAEFVRFVVLAAMIVIPIRLFIASPFVVEGASMSPTFETLEYVIVDKISYRFKSPERGQVVVFDYPKDPKKSFIKRIVGLPGEKISIADGKINVEKETGEKIMVPEKYVSYHSNEFLEISLQEDEYFVLGDNRVASYDSRAWGPVKKDLLSGQVIVRLFPPQKIDFYPGDVDKF